jgi:hypothetical protein
MEAQNSYVISAALTCHFPEYGGSQYKKINYQEDSLSLEGVLDHGRLFGHLVSDLLGQILKIMGSQIMLSYC